MALAAVEGAEASASISRLAWLAMAVLAAAFMLTVGWRSVAWIEADWHTGAYRDKVVMWAAGTTKWTDEELQEAINSLLAAEEALPDDAGIQDVLGALYGLKGTKAWGDERTSREAYSYARMYQQNSVSLRPMVPQAWANLALSQYLLGESNEAVFKSWRESLRLGPHEQGTRKILLNIALGLWQSAPEDVKAWVYSQRDRANPRQAKDLQSWANYYQVNINQAD